MAPPHTPIMPSSKRRLDEAFPREPSPELGQDPLLPAAQVAKSDDCAGEVAKMANRLIRNLEHDVEKQKRTKESLASQVIYLTNLLNAEKSDKADLEKRVAALEKQAEVDRKTMTDAYNLLDNALKPEDTRYFEGRMEKQSISSVLRNIDALVQTALDKAEQHETLVWDVYRCLKNGIKHPRG